MHEAYTIELEVEDDGRWIAELMRLPGVVAYGTTREEAIRQILSFVPSGGGSTSTDRAPQQPGVVFALVDDGPIGPRLLERMVRRIPERIA